MFSSNSSQVSSDANYIEDCFSTYLYTGDETYSRLTITNNIDLSGKGGLVWIKSRSAVTNNRLFDTARGVNYYIDSNDTNSSLSTPYGLDQFNNNGFRLVSDGGSNFGINASGQNYVSWTFRKQPKFYTQGTYTGNGTGTSIGGGVLKRDISHDLGGTVGCVIIKNLDTGNWVVYHRSSAFGTENLRLNTTGAGFNASGYAPIYEVSNTTFSVIVGATGLSSSDNCNINGASYVYYIFAHNAGGFGLTGTDNVISCGSYTGVSSGTLDINLGYETQWVLIKKATANNGVNRDWLIVDTMRGMPALPGYANGLFPNTSGAETVNNEGVHPSATGFYLDGGFDRVCNSGETYIYIAIRRGPMKVPTSGTSVFAPVARTGNGSATTLTSAGFPPDLYIAQERSLSSYFGANWFDRLRGASKDFWSAYTDREFTVANSVTGFDSMNGVVLGSDGGNTGVNYNGIQYANWNFRRAPSFFDEVCYTGNGTAGRTVNHNLGVAPELMIVKRRNSSSDASWIVYAASQGISAGGQLNSNAAFGSMLGYYQWNNTAPTASVFTLGDGATDVNNAAGTYVWYGFATCAGVSKVGSYTGNGTTQTINCGFTGGARFVMIKATSTTGDWMVADSARGIVSGNDPYLELNNTNAEVTGEDWLDTDSTGFVVNEVSGSNANTNGVTYIYLAIA